MRIRIQLPPLDLNVSDEYFGSSERTRRVASEFQEWLRRHLPVEAWNTFAEERYPQLQNTDAVSLGADAAGPTDDDEDAEEVDGANLSPDGVYFLKPGMGESLPDLLRNIAATDPKLADAVNTIVTEESLEAATQYLLQYMAAGHSRREALRDLNKKLDTPEFYGFEYDAAGAVVKRDPRGDNEIVVVLDANAVGSYIGQVADVFGENVLVRFMSGGAAESVDMVSSQYVVRVNETHDVLITYSLYDDWISQTVTKTELLEGVICAIDVTRGVLVAGRLPNREYFKQWVAVQEISGLSTNTLG